MKETLNNNESSNSTKPVLCNGLKSSDLRIGNLVLLKIENEKDEVAKLLSIDEINGCFYNRASNKRFINQKYDGIKNSWCVFKIINPILLTEEWLLNLGFKKDNKLNYVFHFEFNEGYEEITVELYKGGENDFYFRGNILHNDLKYVHQIQNLYFALTQRELTVA